MRIGYFLSCEEYTPARAVAQARLAERPASTGCGSPTTTTPGTTRRARAPFVWSVIGALAEATERLPVTTA